MAQQVFLTPGRDPTAGVTAASVNRANAFCALVAAGLLAMDAPVPGQRRGLSRDARITAPAGGAVAAAAWAHMRRCSPHSLDCRRTAITRA